MDVRCRQCGTEYELDDARVAAAGTTVKCSNCGHVFKVLPGGPSHEGSTKDPSGAVRPAPAGHARGHGHSGAGDTPTLGTPPSNPPQPAPVAAATTTTSGPTASGAGTVSDWMVKKVDGQVFRFRELTTLQKWIVERKVVRDDEISRTGKSWKKLGEIAELTSFFQVVEAAEAAQRSVTASMMPQVHLTATPTGTFQSFPLQQALAQQQQLLQAHPPPTQPITLPPPTVAAASAPLPIPAPLPPPATTPAEATVDLDEHDPVFAWQRRRRRLTLAATLGSAAVVGAIAVGVFIERTARVPAAVVAQTQYALATGDDASREKALQALQAATGSGGTALRARLLAEEARTLREALRLVDEARTVAAAVQAPPALVDGALPKDAAARAEQRLAEAGAAILQSRAEGKGGVDAALAAATAALASGDFDAVAREAGLAREQSRRLSDDARAIVDEELRLLVSLAEAARTPPLDQEAAAAVREKLLRFGDVRARAAAAIASLAAVRVARTTALAQTPPVAVDGSVSEGSRLALAALPAGDPRRAAGEALLTALTTLPPPVEPAVPVEPVVPVEPGAPVVPVPVEPGTTTPGTAPGTPTPGTTGTTTPTPGTTGTPTTPPVPISSIPDDEPFAALMARGEKATAAGRGLLAYEAFKRATTKDPKSAKAWLKLGWASFDVGKKSEAPRAFQRALALSPALSEAQFGLAEALRFAGRKDEAVVAYKQYLDMDPDGKDAGIARNAIKQLE